MKEKQTSFSIKHWADDDKPREKLVQKGRSALSDAELIAILIGSGSRNESAVEHSHPEGKCLTNHHEAINNI